MLKNKIKRQTELNEIQDKMQSTKKKERKKSVTLYFKVSFYSVIIHLSTE